MTPVVIT